LALFFIVVFEHSMNRLKNSSSTTFSSFNKQSINIKQEKTANLEHKDMLAMQSQMTKKRSALGNISNATSSTNPLVSCSNGSNTSLNGASTLPIKEVSKKSRFGVQETNTVSCTHAASVVPVTCVNQVPAAQKKCDSLVTNKKTTLVPKETVSSKENFSSILPNAFRNKKSLPQLPECKQATNSTKPACQSAAVSASSATTNKSDLNEIKQEAILKLEQLKTETGLSKCESMSDIQECLDHHGKTDSLKEELEPAEEEWEDIDANDNDEFNANDYVNYIFKYYTEREDKFQIHDYIKEQPQINKSMRLLLVDWMVEVQQQLEFNHEVLYLSVKLLDLYLSSRRVEKEKLQLLGGAAMFIACKFEERMPPIIDDFIYVSDNAYNRKELIKMEIDILKSVRFDIGIPLSYTFLRRYAKCVKADMKFLTLARYILELSLQDYSFVYVKDSLKACAALFLALKMTVAYENNHKAASEKSNQPMTVSAANLSATEWNATLVHYTGYHVSDFIDLITAMNNLIFTAPSSKYKTIFRKYSHPVFYEVAKVAPLTQNELESLVERSKFDTVS